MNLHLVRSKTVFFLTIAIVFFDRVADPDSLSFAKSDFRFQPSDKKSLKREKITTFYLKKIMFRLKILQQKIIFLKF